VIFPCPSVRLADFPFSCLAYLKKLNKAVVDKKELSEDEYNQWKKDAAGAMKKILANYDNYDVLMGQTMDGDAMFVNLNLMPRKHKLTIVISFRHVLIDFREDGVTPYATVWKDGLKAIKV
jgi:hypothetical protein